MMGETKYIINWITNGVSLKAKGPINVGICERTKRIATISEHFIKPLIVRDTFVLDAQCEEGTRCLDRSCVFNKTTWKSYASSMNFAWMTEKQFVWLIELINSIQQALQETIDGLSWDRPMISAFESSVLEFIIMPDTRGKEGK